jgi:rubrerythrin
MSGNMPSLEFYEKVAKVSTAARDLAVTLDNLSREEYDHWLEFLRRVQKEEDNYYKLFLEINDWTDWAGRKGETKDE